MPARSRSNPLALAVLVCLYERPMHPYEVSQTLRTRHKEESVRLNYGSLYGVIDALERRGLVEAADTERTGRLPVRTIYRITDAGGVEMHDWLAELVAIPAKDYPAFEAAMSFLPALSPDEALSLLEDRISRLEIALAGRQATHGLIEKARLPRLFWLEADFACRLQETELAFARWLAGQIAAGTADRPECWSGGGTSTVAGADVASHPGEVRRRIGYVSQLGGADTLATGRENLVLQDRLYGAEQAAVARRVDELIGTPDLAGFAEAALKRRVTGETVTLSLRSPSGTRRGRSPCSPGRSALPGGEP